SSGAQSTNSSQVIGYHRPGTTGGAVNCSTMTLTPKRVPPSAFRPRTLRFPPTPVQVTPHPMPRGDHLDTRPDRTTNVHHVGTAAREGATLGRIDVARRLGPLHGLAFDVTAGRIGDGGEEKLGIRMGGVLDQLVALGPLDHPSGVHDDRVVADVAGAG